MRAAIAERLFEPGEIPRVFHPAIRAVEPAPAPELHQQIIRISGAALLEYLTGARHITNIPEGSKLLSFWPEVDMDGLAVAGKFLCVRIEHESLPAITPGRRIPQARAKYRLSTAAETERQAG